MSSTRREFLKASAAVTVGGALVGCGGGEAEPKVAPPEPEPNDGAALVSLDPEAVLEDGELFARGVQAGAMTAESALLWTHVADGAPKLLRVWRDAGEPGRVKLVHEGEVSPREGFVKTRVGGLGPGHYRYAFFDPAGERRGPIGRFRTAFGEDDLRPLTIAGLVCSNMSQAPYTALHMTAALGADVLCHLGDMSYNDGAVSLEDYRGKWKATLEEPGYRAAYASAGLYATWDDHELANDLNPERIDPAQLEAAKRSYFETLAIEGDEDFKLWRSYRWGKTAEIFVLDTRSERLPSTIRSEAPIYISRAQMDWLKTSLAASPCHYKIILNSVPITRLLGLWNITLRDRWEGYAAQRDELIGHLVDRGLENVYFLSGDFHCSFVARIEPEGPAQKYWEILVGPTAAMAPNPVALLLASGELPREEAYPSSVILDSGLRAATSAITFDPLNDQVRMRHVSAWRDSQGEVLWDTVLPR